MRPNIFDIATKELSQDAFITWLLQFADDKYEIIDPLLNECGKEFVKALIKKQNPFFNDKINCVKSRRQFNKIDVWTVVNNQYLIIIEDKTYSNIHSNQLQRYKKIAETWCIENNFEQPICIYLKTGNESLISLNNIEKQGFAIFSRIDFINILSQFNKITNNIYLDFYERLTRIELINNEYKNKVIKDWDGNDWQGFFQALEKEIFLEWNRVNNKKGGFWNAVLNSEKWDIYPVYIQLEEGMLTFKISTHPDQVQFSSNVTKQEIRNKFHDLIISQSKKQDLIQIKRPSRFGKGNYMTAAIIDREDWLGKDNSLIDLSEIVTNLNKYMDFLRKII